MAMGGHHAKSNGGHRGKPYGLMLLLAFAAALLGVMTLHKFRERRIFNQLLKDKDRELYSLNLLLQKEMDRSKEMKEKTEEMKSKIYTLRSKKMELDNRLLQMQSTINSLKEEHGTMETALEEKQEEVKILREKEIDSGKKEKSQESSFVEILKQKDSEIEDLKRRLENQVKVWSVSSDDPSNKETNATNTNVSKSQGDAVVALKENSSTTEEKNEAVSEESKEKEDAIKIEKINGVVSEGKDDDGKGAVEAEGKVEAAKLEEVGKSESSENADGGGVGSMGRGRRKGKKLRPLIRKRRSERTRSSATLKHRSSDEERSKDGLEGQILIKPVYESDSGNGKEGEGGDEIKKVEEVSELKSADSEELQTESKSTNGESADSQELQTEKQSTNGESAYSQVLQTEKQSTNGESADSQELQTEMKSTNGESADAQELQTEKIESIEGEDKGEEIDEAEF